MAGGTVRHGKRANRSFRAIGRRGFLAMIGSAAAWPVAVPAQPAGAPVVIGVLSIISRTPEADERIGAFVAGLAAAGWVDGKNLSIEYRFANGQPEKLPALAADLTARHVAVIVALSGFPSAAVNDFTGTIPIVFFTSGDPVKDGVVASLNHPGGRFTGIINLDVELLGKRLELMHELRPGNEPVGLLIDPYVAGRGYLDLAENDARKLGRRLVHADVVDEAGIEPAVAALVREGCIGVVVAGGSPFFVTHDAAFVGAATRHAIPTVSSNLQSTDGVLSYGPSFPDMFRQLATYVVKILAGAAPADLPIEQPAKIVLRVNLKTAKRIGLTVPGIVLARADEVIE
jgi:putative ABC transport system substrate-binding protein